MAIQTVFEKMFVNGEWVDAKQYTEVSNPETNEIIAYVPEATKEDAYKAIDSAMKGASISAQLPIHERVRILKNTISYINNHFEQFVHTIVQESSKTIREARKEVKRCLTTLTLCAEEAKRLEGETISFAQVEGHEERIGYKYRFPIGIVLAITPFNDPLNLVAHKMGPAIATGNAIIIKPSTLTPLSTLRLTEAFLQSGLPPHVVTVLTGDGAEICPPILEHDAISFISFTGGYKTGRKIMSSAGIKKTVMELGSNSPTIIFDDANISKAVHDTVQGAFSVAGQNCLSVQRIYVMSSIYKTFMNQFITETKNLKVGSKKQESTDMGPMITAKEALRVEAWIRDAVERGGSILYGGKREGAFLEPTVLTNVPSEAIIAQEEAFGPVVIIEPFETFSEAIEKANHSKYGLQAGVYTSNIQRALLAVKQLDVGAVMINDSSDVRIDSMPFGGVKHSGIGREGVRYSMEAMTEWKVVAFQTKE
ncbi:aldehyde dehydrogenase family protein [Halalkalibacter sp. APA_J-10(15)]|uniref:aldehyde dehydrogenase family protein n=1 Tax=Halalkalibacter sp. APA_J-10(15) TaxID=2933805 RepID=UPI001FF404F7|nr:aldehyde dehydrogenase family protein [Halalkalibacter sp. APA_J-10(15)]MCK0472044.1 aldehyde dehydrogenase family protein [Halalkalibacter sp. APA_J-10(15)]